MKKITLTTLAAAMALTGAAQADTTTIGGYGELHLNKLQSSIKKDKDAIDFHRFVLFFGHEFNDKIRMFSEFELEHALAKDTGPCDIDFGASEAECPDAGPGEVELEQAYIEMDLNSSTQFKAGVMLIPVGILNETHEPPTFYGVERNPIEKNIIPTTWWEGGIALSGQFGEGFSYDAMISSGLDGGTSIRSGRQKVAKATAKTPAYTGRLKFTGVRGLELAATVSLQDDLTQDDSDDIGSGTLYETHAIYNTGPVSLKALYATWDIDTATANSKDEQEGFFVEAGYKLTEKLGVFARHNEWSNDSAAEDKIQADFGINYWPHEQVVFKADYQSQNHAAGDYDGLNVGVGYQF